MVATHHGLWRISGSGDPERVGDHLHDLMGFTVVGADHFLASGHPAGAPELPPLLGLIESTDGGVTWKSLSLLGEADFHVLSARDGRIYGFNSATGHLMSSTDKREWTTRSESPVGDLAISPADVDTVVATVPESETTLALRRSNDAGVVWSSLDDAPQLLRLAWQKPQQLFGVATDGVVWRSADAGDNWKRVGELPAAPEAFAAGETDLLAAAAGAIWRSSDAGRSWQELHRYENG